MKIFCIVLLAAISSQAAKWTVASFEKYCVEVYDGEMIHFGDKSKTIKCMLGDKEVSSAVFDQNEKLTGYDKFKRQGDFVLRHEIYNSEGDLDNQEIYLPYAKEINLVYFRIDASGKVTDGHYMIPPESIKIIPTAGIAIDSGKAVPIDVALEKIKKLVLKTYKKDLSRLDTGKKTFSELIIGLNQKHLDEIKDLPPKKEPKPAASK